jgi:hypothetical protein
LLILAIFSWAIVCLVGMVAWSLLSDPTEEWLSPAEQWGAYLFALCFGWAPLAVLLLQRKARQ